MEDSTTSDKAAAQLYKLEMLKGSGSQDWKKVECTNYRLISRRHEFSDVKTSVNVFSDDGFLFAVKDVKQGVSYVRCIEEGCDARGNIRFLDGKGKLALFENHKEHNHGNHATNVALMDAYEDLKTRVLDCFMDGVHTVYRKWLAEQNDDEIIAELSWEMVDTTLKRLRLSRFPFCRTQKEFDNLLENNKQVHDDFAMFRGADFYQGMALGSAVFVNNKIMDRIPVDTKTCWYFDGTFKIQPLGFHQLFIGHVEIEGTPHAAVYVLMNSMDQKHYEAVFKYLIDRYKVDVDIVKTDFELAVINAVKAKWRNSKHECCYFHFCQAIHKNFGKKVDAKTKDHWQIEKLFLKLPMLPLNLIKKGLEIIIKRQKKLKVFNDFAVFNSYFVDTWIERFKPTLWCVEGLLSRTNNFCESYNKTIKVFMPRNPSPPDFLRGLQTMAHDAYAKLLARIKTCSLGTPPPVPVSKFTDAVAENLPKLKAKKISILKCLENLADADKE